MKLFSQGTLKKIPVIPVGALIVAILISTTFSAPQYKKVRDLGRKLISEQAELNAIERKINTIKELPEYPANLDKKEDVILVFKYFADSKGYMVTDINEGSDMVGNYVAAVIDINNYKSLADVITSLSELESTMPVAFVKYTMANKSIKAQMRCYFKE